MVHQIKGSGGFFGFAPLTDTAAQIEQATLDADMAAVQANVSSLIELFRRVQGYERFKKRDLKLQKV